MDALWLVWSGRTIRRRTALAGAGHTLIFVGFMVLLAGTMVLGVQVDITQPIFHWSFWNGGFYLGYKLCLDLGGLAFLTGLAIMALRHGLRDPSSTTDGRTAKKGTTTGARTLSVTGCS